MARSTQQEIDARAQQLADDAQLLLDIAKRKRLAEQAQQKDMRKLRHEKRHAFGTVADEAGLFVVGDTTITFLIEEALLRAALRMLRRLAQTPGELEAFVAQYTEEDMVDGEAGRAAVNGHRVIMGSSMPGKTL